MGACVHRMVKNLDFGLSVIAEYHDVLWSTLLSWEDNGAVNVLNAAIKWVSEIRNTCRVVCRVRMYHKL